MTPSPDIALKIFVLDDNTIDREACRRNLSRGAPRKYEFFEHNSVDGALDMVRVSTAAAVTAADSHNQRGTGVARYRCSA